MRTAAKNAAKRQQPTTTKTAAEIEGRDVIAALGGRGVLQEIERAHKHEATPYQAAWVEHYKRLRAFCKLVQQRTEVMPDLQPFAGLNIHGAAHALDYCMGASWLHPLVEQYVQRMPLTAVCDLLVEIAREVLTKPDNSYINGVRWYLNDEEQLTLELGTRGDFGDEITTITRVGVDRRHCHTVDRY